MKEFWFTSSSRTRSQSADHGCVDPHQRGKSGNANMFPQWTQLPYMLKQTIFINIRSLGLSAVQHSSRHSVHRLHTMSVLAPVLAAVAFDTAYLGTQLIAVIEFNRKSRGAGSMTAGIHCARQHFYQLACSVFCCCRLTGSRMCKRVSLLVTKANN